MSGLTSSEAPSSVAELNFPKISSRTFFLVGSRPIGRAKGYLDRSLEPPLEPLDSEPPLASLTSPG
jgi:hypothetical protein